MNFYNIYLDIIEKLSTRLIIYIIGIAFLTTILDYFKDYIKEKRNTKSEKNKFLHKHKYIKAFLVFFIMLVIEIFLVAVSTFFPPPDTTQTGEKLKNSRYNIYDDEKILERVNCINNELNNEGKRIEDYKLKAFIYAMNNDYTLLDSDRILNEVVKIYANTNNDALELFRDIRFKNPKKNLINSLADIFANEDDYTVVLYWQNRYNDMLNKIYEKNFTTINDLCMSLRKFFMDGIPIEINNENYSIYMISDEAKFIILNCICNKADLILLEQNIENINEQIIYEIDNNGIPVYFSAQSLSSDIKSLKSSSFQQIIKKTLKN